MSLISPCFNLSMLLIDGGRAFLCVKVYGTSFEICEWLWVQISMKCYWEVDPVDSYFSHVIWSTPKYESAWIATFNLQTISTEHTWYNPSFMFFSLLLLFLFTDCFVRKRGWWPISILLLTFPHQPCKCLNLFFETHD